MQYFTEKGTSHRDVVKQIKEKYGEQAQIMTHRNIRIGGFLGMFTREGVEISGILSNDRQNRLKKDLESEKNRIITAAAAAQGKESLETSEKSRISAAGLESASDYKTSGVTLQAPGRASVSDSISSHAPGMEQVLSELKEIKEQMGTRVDHEEPEHPNLEKIEELLVQNDFSFGFIKNMMLKVKSELSFLELDDFEQIQHRVLEWIGEEIEIYSHKNKNCSKRIVLIGPTGVGKTTTIAKLAAMSILDQDSPDAPSVRMITIDNYRIGARGQLETYGDIMNIPVAAVETREEMKKKLALFEDIDIIYVDTTGRSQKDYRNIASMRELLEPCGGQAEYFLAVSATTKASDIREICREFEPFNYQGIVLTKLDETMRIGNIISVIAEMKKPLAYITFGQGVPADIERATRMRLLKNLEGFLLNAEKIKEKVGE